MLRRAWLSLGSNVRREENLAAGLDALLALFGNLVVSSVYESDAVGFDGAPFLNLAAGAETGLAVGEIAAALREIENRHGRDRSQPRFSDRTLDIDLLLLGKLSGDHDGVCLPRPETTTQAFVLAPLAEIAPELVIPGHDLPLKQLWNSFPESGLTAVPFQWMGRDLSAGPGAKHFDRA